MKKNLKSFGYKLKKNAILLSLLLGSAIIAGCKQPNGGDDYDDEIVTPVPTPDNPTNPDTPDNPDSGKDDSGDDSGKTDDPSVETITIDNNYDFSQLDSSKHYKFVKLDDGAVDAAKLVYAKKILGGNLSFAETNVNYTLDFSNKSFANTTDEIESRSDFASTLANGVFTNNDYDKTITIGGVTFITHPVAKEGSDNRIQQAFQFDKNVKKVSVTFGDKYNMTEAYKGGIILNGGDNTELTLNNFENTTLTGDVYFESMGDFNVKTKKFKETTLISKLATGDTLPKTSNLFLGNVADSNSTFYGRGIDKIFENYYNNGESAKLSVTTSSAVFDGKDYLNGAYMYDENGNYNDNAYGIDINTALLMGKKLGVDIKNVIITGDMTEETDAVLSGTNTRFSGNVSGLKFVSGERYGIIDFAKVGPKYISAPSAKIVVKGVGDEGKFLGRVVDLSSLSKDVLSKVSTKSQNVGKVYLPTGVEKSDFTGGYAYSEYDNGSSASTNRAWEEAGRNGTLPSDSLSKLDVKAKANNPLLQKLLDENQHVYG